jgi:hypothetical protein
MGAPVAPPPVRRAGTQTDTTAPPAPRTIPDFTGDPDGALRWLEKQAQLAEVPKARLDQIREKGNCDGQKGERIDALCVELGLERRDLRV